MMSETSQRRPLVSICIPTYNGARFLRLCLESAISQTYPNIEILVSDDGSTDETLALVKAFQQQHSFVRLVQGEQNGMVANWNHCIQEAKGDWIKFLFQDDLLHESCVDAMLQACLKERVKVALCRRDFILHENVSQWLKRDFSEGGIPKAEAILQAGYVAPAVLADAVKQHLLQNFLGEPTCYLFHRSLCTEAGLFNPHFKQLVDYEFILRLGFQQGLVFLPQTLAWFRVHGGSESSANVSGEKETMVKSLAAGTGDEILLLHSFSSHPAFALVKEKAGAGLLNRYAKHLYHSACKHRGEKLVNEALAFLRRQYPEIGKMRYSFLRYAYYRSAMKRWWKKMQNAKPATTATGKA